MEQVATPLPGTSPAGGSTMFIVMSLIVRTYGVLDTAGYRGFPTVGVITGARLSRVTVTISFVVTE